MAHGSGKYQASLRQGDAGEGVSRFRMCVFVCVCERERVCVCEREKERECVFV